MSEIQINGNDIAAMPTRLIERTLDIQTEKYAIDGGMQRNRISSSNNPTGKKYEAVLTWGEISAADFQSINNLFVTGSGIWYSNSSSKYGSLAYSGMPFRENEGEYSPGDSKLTDFTIRIRQI